MNIKSTYIKDLYVIETTPHVDDRGRFMRCFCYDALGQILKNRTIVQINHSCTKSAGAIRGMHFQHLPHSEMKLIRCLQGRVWDVAIDLRKNSPTFLKWHGEELSKENAKMMVIPEGFAHGFQTMTDNCELLYLHSAIYTPEAEGAVNAMDTAIAIKWPLEITDISERDRNHPNIDRQFKGIVIQ